MGRGVIEMTRLVTLARSILTIAVSVFFVGGAAAGPTYARPQMPTPPQYRFVEGQQAQSFADMPWFQVFDDPALQALIREAIDKNLDLRVAVARLEESRARAGIAKSFLYPQVDGVANYAIRQGSNTSESNDTTHQSGT